MRRIGFSFDRVVSAGSVLSEVFIVLIMIMIVIEVILRYLFGTSTLVADEFSAYFLAAVTFLGLAYTLKAGGHIRVEVVTDRLPIGIRQWVALLSNVVGMMFCFILTWQTWRMAFESFRFGTLSITIAHTPMFIPQLIVPVGAGLMALQLVVQVVNGSRNILRR